MITIKALLLLSPQIAFSYDTRIAFPDLHEADRCVIVLLTIPCTLAILVISECIRVIAEET